MSAIEQIVNKPIKEMTAIEYLIYEKYIQWNQNGRPKDPRNDKAGHDAIQAAAELTAMQARIEKLELLLLKCKDAVEYTAEFDKEDMETYQEIIKALK
jgi:hypothetical protein